MHKHCVLRNQVLLVKNTFQSGSVFKVEAGSVLDTHHAFDEQLVEDGFEHGFLVNFDSLSYHHVDYYIDFELNLVERMQQTKGILVVVLTSFTSLDEIHRSFLQFVFTYAHVGHQN